MLYLKWCKILTTINTNINNMKEGKTYIPAELNSSPLGLLLYHLIRRWSSKKSKQTHSLLLPTTSDSRPSCGPPDHRENIMGLTLEGNPCWRDQPWHTCINPNPWSDKLHRVVSRTCCTESSHARLLDVGQKSWVSSRYHLKYAPDLTSSSQCAPNQSPALGL